MSAVALLNAGWQLRAQEEVAPPTSPPREENQLQESAFLEPIPFLDLESQSNDLPQEPAMPAMVVTNPVAVPNEALARLAEQQAAALEMISQLRREAEAAAKRNADELTTRLNSIEKALVAQREREAEALRSTNRLTLIVAITFATVGFLGMLMTAVLLVRAMNRFANFASVINAVQPLGGGQAHAMLDAGDASLIPAPTLPSSSGRFLKTIEKLEQRIHELEATATRGTLAEAQPGLKAGSSSEAIVVPDHHAEVTVLLGKGQTLLNMEQADAALSCFDRALALDPRNTDALIKRGTCLERLRRMEEAIAAFDKALAIDNSLTNAYLHKGGICNRLQRFREALECYELALRTQDKARASGSKLDQAGSS
jgi:tetratricopeptide (TPR) repeat protein